MVFQLQLIFIKFFQLQFWLQLLTDSAIQFTVSANYQVIKY